MVGRRTGKTEQCESQFADPHGSWSRLARAYRFDLAVVPAGERWITTTIEDRIVQGDLRDTSFLRRPVTNRAQLVMTRAPTPAETVAPFVPVEAYMRTTCEIQPDLSFFCVDPQPIGQEVDPGVLPILQDAVFEVTEIMRAAPRLRNGRSARGAVVTVDLHLVPPLYTPSTFGSVDQRSHVRPS